MTKETPTIQPSAELAEALKDANLAWLVTLDQTRVFGATVSPRGIQTKELPHHTFIVDMNRPVVCSPARKVSYRFMCAEAAWILSGSNKLEDIVKYAPRMAEFSDDGVTLAGAYGPKVMEQVGYVGKTLLMDPDSRQAVMTLWRPNPAKSKDIPCTIALDFKIRDGRLNCHAYMRSSDQWLGLPYDTFTFSMVSAAICSAMNFSRSAESMELIKLGTLYLTASSSHQYATNWPAIQQVLEDPASYHARSPVMPASVSDGTIQGLAGFIDVLKAWRDGPQPFFAPVVEAS